MEIINTAEEFNTMKSRNPVKLKCLHCGSEFILLKHRVSDYIKRGGLHGSFCSSRCKNNNKNKQKLIKCDLCEKMIYKTLRDLRKSEKHFCSTSCSAKYWNTIRYPIKAKRVLNIVGPAEKINLICSTCSKEFIRYKSSLRETKTGCRFCSKTCRAIYANKTWNRSSRFGLNKSRCEIILKNIIVKEYPDINLSENDRTILPNSLELDLYFPDKKVAIELNGPCHYIPIFGSEELKKTQNKDILKIKFCQDNNIRLFIINVMGLKNQTKTLQEVFNKQLKSYLS